MTTERDITELFGTFGFTPTESRVYLALLKDHPATGYQVAKALNLARSSVYSALDSLCLRGAAFRASGDTAEFLPKSPDALVSDLKTSTAESADRLGGALESWSGATSDPRYFNLEGEAAVVGKVRELMAGADREVLINTDFPLDEFAAEIQQASEHGVRVAVFSFRDVGGEDLPIERFCFLDSPEGRHALTTEGRSRIMMVVDFDRALIASRKGGDYSGSFSSHRLFASIISEHIHHDIYLYRLFLRDGDHPIDDSLLLGSLMETQRPVRKDS